MRKQPVAYVLVLVTFGVGIVAVLKLGSHLQNQKTEQTTRTTQPEQTEAASNDPARSLYENLHDSLSI
jgi:hypothetical protein